MPWFELNQYCPRPSSAMWQITSSTRPWRVVQITARPSLSRVSPPPYVPIHSPPSGSGQSAQTKSLLSPFSRVKRVNWPSFQRTKPVPSIPNHTRSEEHTSELQSLRHLV